MMRQLLPIFIIFFFTSKSVSAVSCGPYEIQCYDSSQPPNSWCCPNYDGCGFSPGTCISFTSTVVPTPTDLSPGVAVVIVFISLFFCIMCIGCCVRVQQQQQRHLRGTHQHTHGHLPARPYQQPVQRPPVVVGTRPIRNVGAAPPLHIINEELPPSYEDATRNLPFAEPSAPIHTTTNDANLRV